MKNPRLWQKIKQFSVDDKSVDLRFVQRLADDNGWTPQFAADAYEEYLRFIYLATIATTSRTPSDAVDQVWHLHLAYSRSYWQALCSDTLGKPLHHEPTTGGSQQAEKHSAAYVRTLSCYEEEFSCPPPPQFWPPLAKKTRRATRFQRINTSAHFVLRKRTAGYAYMGMVALAFASSAQAKSTLSEAALITFGVMVCIPVVILLLLWLFGFLKGKGRGGGRSGGGFICGSDGGSSGGSGGGSSCGGGGD